MAFETSLKVWRLMRALSEAVSYPYVSREWGEGSRDALYLDASR